MDTTNPNSVTRFPSNIAKMFPYKNLFKSVTKCLKSPVTQFLFKFLTRSVLRCLSSTAKKCLNSIPYKYLSTTATRCPSRSALKFLFRSQSRFQSKFPRRFVDIIEKSSFPSTTSCTVRQLNLPNRYMASFDYLNRFIIEIVYITVLYLDYSLKLLN